MKRFMGEGIILISTIKNLKSVMKNQYNFIKLKKKYESKLNLSWNIGVKLFNPIYKNFFKDH